MLLPRLLLLPAVAVIVALVATGSASAAERAATLTVEATVPTPESWAPEIRADGPIAPWSEAVVAAGTGGLRLTALSAEVGDVVRAGQVLATLDEAPVRAELAVLEAAKAEAEAAVDQAKSEAVRAETLRTQAFISEQQLMQNQIAERTANSRLSAAKARIAAQRLVLDQCRIIAPDDGIVTVRSGNLGQVVQNGSELFRLQRQSRVEWRASVLADDMAKVAVGQIARLEVPGAGTLTGSVRLVDPTVDPATRTGLVRVELPAGTVRPGQFATGVLCYGEAQPVPTLPVTAVVERDGRSLVLAIQADGTVRELRVVTGRRQRGRVEILSGTTATTRVVASGGGFIADGDGVTVVAAASTTAASQVDP